jgi:hypothetical protein
MVILLLSTHLLLFSQFIPAHSLSMDVLTYIHSVASNYIKGKFCVSVCVSVRYRTYRNVVGMGSKLLGVLRKTLRWSSTGQMLAPVAIPTPVPVIVSVTVRFPVFLPFPV